MRQSKLFTKTQKEAPKDEVSKNAQLLTRAGYIHKNMAGVYEFLPLGLRVMNKVANIVREEMNAIGGQEVKMTVLQDPKVWKTTERWNDNVVDNWFKTTLADKAEVGLGLTHEEPLAHLLEQYVSSYRDLPIYPYQIQVKFRNELRAKSGIMRGREFLMKDMYSFTRSPQETQAFHEVATQAYLKVFERVGLGDQTFVTFASGGIFSKYSREFQTISDAGEDTIYLSREKNIAVNKEVYNDEVLSDLGLTKEDLEEKKAIEVGNIFELGNRFSMGLTYKDEDGKEQSVYMGSYGIGISRLMGTVAEILSDEKGLVWPESIAPFKVHLLVLSGGEKEAEALYNDLQKAGIEVLFDDRDMQAGAKFADADLLGIPYRLVVSAKSLEKGGVEMKKRSEDTTEIVTSKEVIQRLGSRL